MTQATYPTGARFAAITYFLNNCGNQPNAKFAVIGFSDFAGQVSGAGASASMGGCSSIQFGSAQQAQAEINALSAVQTAEGPWYTQWTQSTNNYLTATAQEPPILRGTSYTNALTCANQVIVGDLTQPSATTADSYQVIFISGRSPYEEAGTGCNLSTLNAAQQNQCYLQNVTQIGGQLVQSALAMGKQLSIFGVFYGLQEVGIPVAMSTLTSIGGTGPPMQLTSFQGNANAFCQMVGAKLNVDMNPDSFMAVNMTTINKADVLSPDSDMDGISDADEIRLGYDPTNPRSRVSGVLDGICEKVGGLATCQSLRSQITCNPTLFYNYLTDCDVKILGLFNSQNISQGVDTDGDTIPDFIEIVKGTNPSSADAGSDPDGDTVSNLQEIIHGTDPFTPDLGYPNSLMNLFSTAFVPNLPNCSNGGWQMSVSQTQTSPTLAVSAWPAAQSALNHAANEQVLWLGYRLVPMNGANQYIQYFNKMITVQSSGQGIVQQPLSGSSFTNSDFSHLGNILP